MAYRKFLPRCILSSLQPRLLFCTQSKSLFPTVQTGAFQSTVLKAVSRSGVGLHTGATACLKIMPAAAGEGRYFVHIDDGAQRQDEEVRIPAVIHNVVDTTLSTCIGLGKVMVRTVEHMLSALEGLGVDNCRIEIEGGNEVPLLDGSARLWVDAVLETGITFALDKEGNKVYRSIFTLKDPLIVTKEDAFVAALPSSRLRITCGIDFQEVPEIRTQWFSICLDDCSLYASEIAPARTFCIAEQIPRLRSAGLIKGGSIDNAIVCSLKDGWLNPPLRFSDEPCRHKLLDLIGDLALCAEKDNQGLPLAHIIAFKAGHQLHIEFGNAVLNAKNKGVV